MVGYQLDDDSKSLHRKCLVCFKSPNNHPFILKWLALGLFGVRLGKIDAKSSSITIDHSDNQGLVLSE